MEVTAVYETVLYADDVPAAARFYADVVGLREIERPDPTAAAFRLADGGVLLIFDPAQASRPGRPVPSHGTTGPGHIAFRVTPGTLPACAAELEARDIALERELSWPAGGRSLYVRDPVGNSVEFVDGEVWH